MRPSTPAFDDFQGSYRLQSPKVSHGQQAAKQLGYGDGLRRLELAPATGVMVGTPPLSSSNRGTHRYLWVIDASGIPYILEAPILALGTALPKHTNLTGGKEAYLGGEMWFTSGASMYISGGSGRYPPANSGQLEDAGGVFRSLRYGVTSLGWDDDAGVPKRFLESP